MRNQRFFYDVRQYAMILNDQQQFLALQLPDNYGEYGGCWTLPGGKLEPKDSPESGLLREIKEETGLTAKIVCPYHIGRWESKRSKKLVIFYLCQLKGLRKKIKLSNEHQAHAWLDLTDLKAYGFYQDDFGAAIKKAYALDLP